MGMCDAELMARWRQGDAGAFEALVARWQGPMARFLDRYTGRPEAVPDLCQEVFLRLYHAGPRYREADAFSPWLYRIAVNVARDAVRRGRRAPEPLRDREPPDRGHPAEVVCRRRELADHLRRAVAGLPEILRLTLVLRHDEGLAFEEIARLTGTPASTVKTRFAAALQRLRVELERLGYGPEEIEP
jgi:RNA polymerase sigma-70 factor (ECF subfamily)